MMKPEEFMKLRLVKMNNRMNMIEQKIQEVQDIIEAQPSKIQQSIKNATNEFVENYIVPSFNLDANR